MGLTYRPHNIHHKEHEDPLPHHLWKGVEEGHHNTVHNFLQQVANIFIKSINGKSYEALGTMLDMFDLYTLD